MGHKPYRERNANLCRIAQSILRGRVSFKNVSSTATQTPKFSATANSGFFAGRTGLTGVRRRYNKDALERANRPSRGVPLLDRSPHQYGPASLRRPNRPTTGASVRYFGFLGPPAKLTMVGIWSESEGLKGAESVETAVERPLRMLL